MGMCKPCQAGYYQPSPNKSVCLACPPGSFSYTGSSQCIICPRGTITTNNGTSRWVRRWDGLAALLRSLPPAPPPPLSCRTSCSVNLYPSYPPTGAPPAPAGSTPMRTPGTPSPSTTPCLPRTEPLSTPEPRNALPAPPGSSPRMVSGHGGIFAVAPLTFTSDLHLDFL